MKTLVTSAAPDILGDPAYDQDGALYTGSNFGQLRKRDSQGTWHAINTRTMSPASASERRGTLVGKYYLANAWAALYRLDLAANSWKKLTLPHDVTSIRTENEGAIVTANYSRDIYSKLSLPDFGDTWTRFDNPWNLNALQINIPPSACVRTIRDQMAKQQFCVSRVTVFCASVRNYPLRNFWLNNHHRRSKKWPESIRPFLFSRLSSRISQRQLPDKLARITEHAHPR